MLQDVGVMPPNKNGASEWVPGLRPGGPGPGHHFAAMKLWQWQFPMQGIGLARAGPVPILPRSHLSTTSATTSCLVQPLLSLSTVSNEVSSKALDVSPGK
uniref:Uncharacterized protein n=1 Tax=Timema shepardi TaxID=629360 RepID=A0A7R9AQ04_TIMSH|nr:unnamed protein product [Timema shepardi]